jgi:hypothetical protein
MSSSPGQAGPCSGTGPANNRAVSAGTSSGAVVSRMAARPGWTGRVRSHAIAMPQPWTLRPGLVYRGH